MAKSGPETRLVNRMRKAVSARWPEAFVVKVHGSPYQRAGLPDLLVIVGGRAVWLEVKAQAPGESEEHARGRVTALQQVTLDDLARSGAVAGVAITVAEVLAYVASAQRT
jgi:hypothetical protein